MTDLERTNLERPRINSNTTSNKLERITQNMFFFTIIEQTKHKKNLQINLQNKRRYITKTYNTTK